MMRLINFVFLFLFCYCAHAQRGYLDRLVMEEGLAPFYHGVASGDPTPTNVIIWTRVETVAVEVEVAWEMATDPAMSTIVQSGTVTTNADRDYTVKVDVGNLSPYTYYYYRFNANGKYSMTGRTKTAPSGANTQVRLGVFSCSSYAHGFFNAYRDLVNQNDVDAVLHLGDYIYEYRDGGFGDFRVYAPDNEITRLTNYRTRYAYYRLDPDLRDLHQQYPFITVWDDHESANNAYKDGAENHDAGEGDWAQRKAESIQAYKEWMPIREAQTDEERIFRKYGFGNLADVYFLDTRLYGRTEQGAGAVQDRRILGDVQYNWLTSEMAASTAKWQIMAQQVMVAPVEVGGNPINNDQWDGYVFERDNLFNFITDPTDPIDNFVVLTGDIHTSWANNIPLNNYSGSGAACSNSVGVEFVATSVTSPGIPDVGGAFSAAVYAANDHVQYVNLDDRGYIVVDVTDTAIQADWRYVNTITSRNFTISGTRSYKVDDGVTCTVEAAAPIPSPAHLTNQPLAPVFTSTTTLARADQMQVKSGNNIANGAHVFVDNNPENMEDVMRFNTATGITSFNILPAATADMTTCSFHTDENMSTFTIEIVNCTGKIIQTNNWTGGAGENAVEVNLSEMESGLYFARLKKEGIVQFGKYVFKIN